MHGGNVKDIPHLAELEAFILDDARPCPQSTTPSPRRQRENPKTLTAKRTEPEALAGLPPCPPLDAPLGDVARNVFSSIGIMWFMWYKSK